MRYLILFIFVVLFVVIPSSNATQDVEDPQDIILFIRTVMSEPIVAAEISKLVQEGCTWDSEVFWSGSPSEENLKSRIFWMNFSLRLATQNGDKFWKSFAFSRRESGPILEIIETTDANQVVDCLK